MTGLALALTTAALAGPQTYASRAQAIRAGVLVFASDHTGNLPPSPAVEFPFYNLDANRSVKPIGWNIYNPHAPSQVTADIFTRFTALGRTPPAIGLPISKRDAPYWEVFINSPAAVKNLMDYDILLADPGVFASLNTAEREGLRAFVDHGGILWIDPSRLRDGSAGIDPNNGFPIAFGALTVTQDTTIGSNTGDTVHPLLNKPFTLSTSDLALLNNGLPGISMTRSFQAPQGALTNLVSSNLATYFNLRPVTFNGSNATMAIAQIGDGFVVVTPCGAAQKLNRVQLSGLSYTSNNLYQARLPVLEQDGLAAAKLVVNMISMLNETRQSAGGARKTSSTTVTTDAPLLNESIDTTASFGTSVELKPGAIVYKGIVYTTVKVAGGYQVVAYDPNPSHDFDGDGNPDDGLADSTTDNVDVIWRSGVIAENISSPTAAEVTNFGNSIAAGDQVYVTDSHGALYAFAALPRLANGFLSKAVENTPLYKIVPPNDSNTISDSAPLPPTVSEGYAYVVRQAPRNGGSGNGGAIYVVDLLNHEVVRSSKDWYIGGATSGFASEPFIAEATVGYIPIYDNSGGYDKVIYIPTQNNSGQGIPAGVSSIWLGAKGEKPSSVTLNGSGGLDIATRASDKNGLPIYLNTSGNAALNPKITLLDANGNPLALGTYFNGQISQTRGVITLGLTGTGSNAFNSAITANPPQIRVDYTIDWGDDMFQAVAGSVLRGSIQLPDRQNSISRQVTGPVALSPRGTLFVNASNGSTGGVYGFQEQGRGTFAMTLRYEFYPQHGYTPQGGTQQTLPATVDDNDGVINMASILNSPLQSFDVIGSPAIHNDQVFVTVAATKRSGVKATLLMAFRANADAPHFNVDSVPDGSVLVQGDTARSTMSGTISNADVPSILPSANFEYDSDTHQLRIPSLTNVQNGAVQQALDLSQPVYLRTPGGSDSLIQPDTQDGASWNPLIWYSVINGYQAQTGPLVAGDTVFFGSQSNLPGILDTPFTLTRFNGLLYAVQSDIPASDDFLAGTTSRPWLKQLLNLKVTGNSTSPFSANPDVKWPQLSGVQDGNSLRLRINQTLLGNSNSVLGLAAGGNALVALGDKGVYTYDQANVLVADEGRLALFDGSGNPLWSTTATAEAGAAGSAGKVHRLVRPTRAYRVNDTEMLVVDSGSNRVFKMDRSGVETRSISEFALDPNFSPTGYPANGSLTLSDPRDAVMFSNINRFGDTTGLSPGDGEGANDYEWWDHYLIADSGNQRLIEVIDRYAYNVTTGRIGDAVRISGTPQLGILYWHSPASVGGKRYTYTSVNRALIPNGNAVATVFVAGVSTALPTAVDTGTAPAAAGDLRTSGGGNGGIIVFDSRTPDAPTVINQLALPSLPKNIFWNPTTASFNSPAVAAKTRLMSDVSAVTTSVTGFANNYVLRIMVSEGSGFYEGVYAPGSPILAASWMLPSQTFKYLRFNGNVPSLDNAAGLRPMYAKRSGNNVLLVNGFYGTTLNGAPYSGEILQVNGNDYNATLPNLNFTFDSITLRLSPTIGSVRGIVLPVFAGRG